MAGSNKYYQQHQLEVVIGTSNNIPVVAGPISKIYGLAMFIFSQAAIVIWAMFLSNRGPLKIDEGSLDVSIVAWMVNIGLILFFGAQHSIMAREGFKNFVTNLVPAHLERSTFVGISGASLLLMAALWQPLPTTVYQFDGLLRSVTWVIYGTGWLLVIVSTLLIDSKALHGLRQSFTGDARESSKELLTPSLYKLVRHPMMLGFLVVLWATPHMTEGRLLLAITMTVYLFIGMYFEEKALVRHFGTAYEDYRKEVPMILPWPRQSTLSEK